LVNTKLGSGEDPLKLCDVIGVDK